MRNKFFIALGCVIILAAAFIAYGIFLNYKSDVLISNGLKLHSAKLNCSKTKMRELNLSYTLQNVSLNAENVADAIAQVDGSISELFIFKNKQVKKGEPLARLSNPDVHLNISKAHSALLKADAMLKHATTIYMRFKELVVYDAVSKLQLDEAEANYLSAQAGVAEAQAAYEQAKLMADRLTICAPIDGSASIIYKNAGSYMNIGMPLCLISNFNTLWFAANMPDTLVKRLAISPDFTATFKNDPLAKVYQTEYSKNNQGTNQTFPVRLQGIYPALDEPAAIRRIVWYIDNRTAMLEPRNYGNMTIRTPKTQKVLSVPLAAMKDSRRNLVYVVKADNYVEPRQIETGLDDGNYIEVISGLKEGEIVVSSSTYDFDESIRVNVILQED